MVAGILSIVVLGQLLPPPEDPGAMLDRLLQGCVRTPLNSGGSQYNCGPILASVSGIELRPAQALSSAYQGIVATLDGTVTSSDTAVTYENRTGPMRRFEVRKPASKDVSFVGRLAAVDVGKGSSWVLFCGFFASASVEQATARCDALLAGFARVGPRTPPPLKEPVFRGRRLAVPPGCSAKVATETSTLIACPDGELTLVTLAPGVDPSTAKEVVMQQALKALPNANETGARKCRIEGTEVSCRVAESPSSILLVASREFREGGAVIATCQQPLAMRRVHPACSTLLSFDASTQPATR